MRVYSLGPSDAAQDQMNRRGCVIRGLLHGWSGDFGLGYLDFGGGICRQAI
jgi:hypothetical protein